ncbi:MAG: EpsG family protein [Cetobacterium sp.]
MIFILIAIALLLLGIFDAYSKNEKKRERVLIGVILFLILFLGTRGFLGWDWYFYYPSFINGTYIYEKGYMLYSLVIGKIFKNYVFYQTVSVAVDLICFYFIFKKYSKYSLMAFAIFFSIQGLHIEVELLRNTKSIILFLFSLRYIEERKPVQFLLLNFLGCLFHISSIVYIPMYFILNYNYKKKIILFLFLIGSLYYFFEFKIIKELLSFKFNFLPEIIKNKIINYKQLLPNDLNRGFNLFYIERAIIFYLAYKYEKNNILKNSLYIWVYIFLFMSELPIVSLRIGILFVYGAWIILVRSMEYVDKKIIISIIILLSFTRIYRSITFPANIINYKYENVFFKKLDYKKREKELIESKKYLKDSYGKELLIQY